MPQRAGGKRGWGHYLLSRLTRVLLSHSSTQTKLTEHEDHGSSTALGLRDPLASQDLQSTASTRPYTC